MKARIVTALGLAILLSLAAAYFGISFVQRMRSVAHERHRLTEQLSEWAAKADESGLLSLREQLAVLTNHLSVEDAKRQFAASAAKATAEAMDAVKSQLDEKNGLVGAIQDTFEDEFGRPIVLTDKKPPRYDAGPAPTISSDPFRYPERMAVWSTATAAVAGFNELSRLSQPDLDRYKRELAAQKQILDDAEKKWQALKSECDLLRARMNDVLASPRQHLPSAEELRAKIKNCTLVATVFGISDAAAFLTSLPLAVAVWLRTALIAGWFRVTRIISE